MDRDTGGGVEEVGLSDRETGGSGFRFPQKYIT